MDRADYEAITEIACRAIYERDLLIDALQERNKVIVVKIGELNTVAKMYQQATGEPLVWAESASASTLSPGPDHAVSPYPKSDGLPA